MQVVPADPGWGDVFANIGAGAVEGYQNRADEKALQKAIIDAGENPTPQQILKAITGARTYNPESKANFFKNYLGAAQVEAAQAKAARAGELTPYQKRSLEIQEARLKQQQNKDATRGEMTPYQRENLRLQQVRLDNETKKIDNAREKNSRDLPKLIAAFNENYTKDLGLSAEEKLEFDKNVLQEYSKEGGELQDAVTTAFEIMQQKQELLSEIPVVSRPALYGFDEAKQQMTQVLQQLYDQGITLKKDLVEVAKRGGWNGKEAGEMYKALKPKKTEAPAAAPAAPAAPAAKAKVKFNPQNPEHAAKAQLALQQAKGDRAAANALLFQEFEP